MSTTALAPRTTLDLGRAIKTPADFTDRVRALSTQAHIVSPIMAVAEIPDCYSIVPALVVIDPDPAKNDVYAGTFHKKEKVGDSWRPTEVSLSKTGLLKIMAAAGVKITRSERTDDGRTPHYWSWCSEGTVTEFSSIRALPPGNAEVDLRDGSAQIGEWNPEAWALREADAEKRRQATPEKDRWKVKPEPIGGWSKDRLMQARAKGLRICESLSLNALIRNLGLPQKFTTAELAKPFVVFRTVYEPDMRNPQVAAIVTAAHFGAAHLLYPGTTQGAPLTLAPPTETALPDPDAAVIVASVPAGAVEIDDIPEPVAATPAEPVYRIAKVSLLGARYFFETDQGVTFTTEDAAIARGLNEARKAGRAVSIDATAIELDGVAFREVVEFRSAAAAPSTSATVPPGTTSTGASQGRLPGAGAY